ncbi:MAG: SLC13 family permease [Candidatus Omnitrophota bacterium]
MQRRAIQSAGGRGVFKGAEGVLMGLNGEQFLVIAVFSAVVVGTLFFWEMRFSLVFLASSLLFLTRVIDLEHFIQYASLDVILFLIGMMAIVGMMREAGIFHWMVRRLISRKDMSGSRLFFILMFLSALLSALMGEVAGIMVMVAVIIEICNLLDVNPSPLVVGSVISTNIGSAATVLGNPIGVLIALRGNFSFEDFLAHALPVSLLVLIITVGVLFLWNRKYLRGFSAAIASRAAGGALLPPVYLSRQARGMAVIFAVTVLTIAFHRRLELMLGLETNELLIVIPVIFAGIAMLYRRGAVEDCLSKEIEWVSLLFFIFLFALTGALQASGVAGALADRLIKIAGNRPEILSGLTVFSSGVLSSILDNTVVVSSYIPIIHNLETAHSALRVLWWGVLFGACFGGNITAIGSTANIVAIDCLKKQKGIKINFMEWFKIGLLAGTLSLVISFLALKWF